MKKMMEESYVANNQSDAFVVSRKLRVLTVFTKNQCLVMTSASKKNAAPSRAWARKSEARIAIHLKIAKPAPDFKTNMAIACCVKRPTMTVGLKLS